MGYFNIHELFQYTAPKNFVGVAAAKENEREYYLAFINGEAEGAIYIDEKGSLYSDKAVIMITRARKI